MIKARNVVRMKFPYPSVSSVLAVQAHMYICLGAEHPKYAFVKCQTLKPYMLWNNPLKHFVDEKPDISRNPFSVATRIDCDKLFTTEKVKFSDELLATARPDVCMELYDAIASELGKDGYDVIKISNEEELARLNRLISIA